MNRSQLLSIATLLLLGTSCAPPEPDFSGIYHGILDSPGGTLAFPIQLSKHATGYSGFVTNGADTARFTSVEFRRVQDKTFATLDFSHYDAVLEAEVAPDGSMRGNWNKRATKGQRSFLPFTATKVDSVTRYPQSQVPPEWFLGEWNITITDDDGPAPATAIFTYANHTLFGTFLTETGDYRFLEGYYADSTLVMSTFDGAYAYLFSARIKPDGRIEGDFWSRETYHATWTGTKGTNQLRDPWKISSVKKGTPLQFSFPDLDGTIVSNTDATFKDKPVLLYLFGSWCPNCADEAKMLKELYPEFEQTGLQIVGLAYEYSGEFASDAEMVRRYKARFAIPWRSLLAGISDKSEAAKTLPFMDEVSAFPTAIFADRNHKIQAVHVGFRGPSTGSYYFVEKENFRNKLKEITR